MRAPGAARAALVALMGLAACGSPRPASRPVEIRGFRFAPDTVEVDAGDTLVWTNHDLVPHTATAAGGAWDSGAIAVEGSGRWVAASPGTHDYLCAYHPTMRGTVVVR